MPSLNPGFLSALPGISGILVTPFDSNGGHVRPPGAWPLTERQSKDLRRALTEWGVLAGPRAATA